MLGLTIRFLAGRFHATGWDHQVNEGTIEWPPSPWRLLRALVAAAHRLRPAPSDEALTALLAPLAEALPSYSVPPYGESHTRHYMPLDNKGLPGDKSALILDAFVAPGSAPDSEDGELYVVWPDATLGDAEAELLTRLCEQLGYLGRAESWVRVTPRLGQLTAPRILNCAPASGVERRGDVAPVRLMAPARHAEHLAWYEHFVATRRAHKNRPPKTLLDVLRQDTGLIRRAGWSSVPGARWVTYDLRRRGMRRRFPDPTRDPPTHGLFRIAGPVLPGVTKTLQVGERMHAALVHWSDDGGGPHPTFTGPSMAPAETTGSGHAAVCPLDIDGDGRLDHVLVHARDGFDIAAEDVLSRGRSLRGVGAYPLTVTLVATWTTNDVRRIPARELPAVLRTSRRWRSSTPFLLIRHPKRRKNGDPRRDPNGRWLDGPEAQLRLELERRALPAPLRITPLEARRVGGRRLPWHQFQRTRRNGGGARGGDRGYGFEVEFDRPVRGPILVGYGRFFGLGQLEPAPDP